MRVSHRYLIWILVGIFFAAGWMVRSAGNPTNSLDSASNQNSIVRAPGTPVATVDLSATDVDFRPLETLILVVNNLRRHYVEQITDKTEGQMTYDALKAMLAELDDPETKFLEPKDRKIIDDAAQGKFHGIGAILGIKKIKSDNISEEHLLVVTPIDQGPAAKAGLQPGDDIVAVDGKSVLPFDPYQKANEIYKAGLNKKTNSEEFRKQLEAEKKRIDNGIGILQAEKQLVADDDKEVELTIARKASPKELKIKIKPQEFSVKPIAESTIENNKVGYIKVNYISGNSKEDFAGAINKLNSQDVSGLVLDLRNATGADVKAMEEMAGYFIPGKKIATLMQSHGRKSVLTAPASNVVWRKPTIVLVNSGTSKMAEVFASALKDNKAAEIAGQQTYGSFKHSTIFDQQDGSAVIFTTGLFLSSAGNDYNGSGLPVNVELASSAGDSQLKEAVKLLSADKGRS